MVVVEHQAVGDDGDVEVVGVSLDATKQEPVVLSLSKDGLASNAPVVDAIVVAWRKLDFAVWQSSPFRRPRCGPVGARHFESAWHLLKSPRSAVYV